MRIELSVNAPFHPVSVEFDSNPQELQAVRTSFGGRIHIPAAYRLEACSSHQVQLLHNIHVEVHFIDQANTAILVGTACDEGLYLEATTSRAVPAQLRLDVPLYVLSDVERRRNGNAPRFRFSLRWHLLQCAHFSLHNPASSVTRNDALLIFSSLAALFAKRHS